MRTVFKYTLKPEGVTLLQLPKGSRLLSAAGQGDDIMVWAEVEEDQPLQETHKVYVYGTGHLLKHSERTAKFLGTVFHPDGHVFHVYHS